MRFRIRRPPDFERLHVGRLVGDVFRQLDVRRAGLLQTREAERLPDDLRRRLGAADARAPLRDGAEHAHHVDVLVRLLVRSLEADLSSDRNEWSAIDLRVGDAGEQVGRARAQRREAHPGV